MLHSVSQYFECGHAALLAPPSTTPELVDGTEELRTPRQLTDGDEFKGQKGTQKPMLCRSNLIRVIAETSRFAWTTYPSIFQLHKEGVEVYVVAIHIPADH